MRPMPREPFCQIAAKAANDTRMDRPAQASAPKNVASAGRTSRNPKRTMITDTMAVTAANTASRRAQVASAEYGSD